MIQIEKANVVLDIPSSDLNYYIARGYREVKVEKPEPKKEEVKPKRTRKTTK